MQLLNSSDNVFEIYTKLLEVCLLHFNGKIEIETFKMQLGAIVVKNKCKGTSCESLHGRYFDLHTMPFLFLKSVQVQKILSFLSKAKNHFNQ